MKEIEKIILTHLKKYPLMEVSDCFKLIYQNEFGIAHLLTDLSLAKNRLILECNSIKDNSKKDIIEDIGNGYYRYYLYNLKIDVDKLFDLMVKSANKSSGNIEGFNKKIEVFKNLIIQNKTPYNLKEFEAFLDKYIKDGYPIISHSKVYKENYKPAYRIIRKEYYGNQ